MKPSRGARLAERVRQGLDPETLVLLVPFFVVAGTQGPNAWSYYPAYLWGAFAAVCSVFAPFFLVVRGSDSHAVMRLAGYASPLLGVVVMLVADAPPGTVAIAAAMAVALFATVAVRGSLQVAAYAAAVALAAIYEWGVAVFAAVLLAMVCWARLRLGVHDLGRVAISAVVGPAAGLAVFLLAR